MDRQSVHPTELRAVAVNSYAIKTEQLHWIHSKFIEKSRRLRKVAVLFPFHFAELVILNPLA